MERRLDEPKTRGSGVALEAVLTLLASSKREPILALGLLLGNADPRLVPPRDSPQGF